MDRPDGIVDFEPSAEHFPFESRWFASSVGPIHYIDEGTGRPVVLFHGNPDWSFLYRKIVVGLRDRFRCVAMDYPGFGLSVQPDDSYGFTSAEHAVVVGELVEHLDFQDMVVMGQDWGGPIGMDVASRMPERIGGLVMGNTLFWPADSFMMNSFSRMMGSPPLQSLITKRNFFVTPIMKRILKAKLTDAEFDHYVSVVPTPRSRRGIAEFPKQIRAARPWLAELEQRVKSTLIDKPIVLVWGMKDPVFGRGGVLEHWEATFPQATVIRLETAGHYIQEDAPEQIVDAIANAYGPDGG
ncbi:MAG: alpha/beta fold hydrolase [Acidobacteria bacterium]|nr:alpha/beta fold hydrolase [Acidobacteriota bacterium]